MNEKTFIALVDHEDQEVGARPLGQVYHDNLLHQTRAVVLFVYTDDGNIWMTQTAHHSPLFPNTLFPSVLAYLEPEQSYLQALHEQTFEQLGINIQKYKKEELGYIVPEESGQGFVTFYKVRIDVAGFDNDPHFFERCEWMSVQHVKKIREMGTSVHPYTQYGLQKWFGL